MAKPSGYEKPWHATQHSRDPGIPRTSWRNLNSLDSDRGCPSSLRIYRQPFFVDAKAQLGHEDHSTEYFWFVLRGRVESKHGAIVMGSSRVCSEGQDDVIKPAAQATASCLWEAISPYPKFLLRQGVCGISHWGCSDGIDGAGESTT